MQKPRAGDVERIPGGAAQLGTQGADMAIMSGHVAQFILGADDFGFVGAENVIQTH